MPYTYDETLHRYRNTDTGQLVSFTFIAGMSETSMSAGQGAVKEITQRFLDQTIDSSDWRKLMQEAIKRETIRQYAVGRGGIEQLTAKDWGIIGRYLRDEYAYLDRFKQAIDDGLITNAQIQYRASLYIEHTGFVYERAKTHYLPKLPAYPKDGHTDCKVNCKCFWDIQEVDGGYDCYWITTANESCDDCIDRSSTYAPLRVRDGKIV